jgi:hypothetical protein
VQRLLPVRWRWLGCAFNSSNRFASTNAATPPSPFRVKCRSVEQYARYCGQGSKFKWFPQDIQDHRNIVSELARKLHPM